MSQTSLLEPAQIDIVFETLSVPPPYSYTYSFQLSFQPTQVQVAFSLKYTDRDELSEEEIWEEGFTQDDDFNWQGVLPEVWKTILLNQWRKTHWIQPDDSGEALENALEVTFRLDNGEQQRRVPKAQPEWEYLLQELTQAVYEASQRESPLAIRYLELDEKVEEVSLHLSASFLHRSVEIVQWKNGRQFQKGYSWSALSQLLAVLYQLDFHTEKASSKQPRRPGEYLDPGDGLWYAFGKQVTNPGSRNTLSKLHSLLSALLKE